MQENQEYISYGDGSVGKWWNTDLRVAGLNLHDFMVTCHHDFTWVTELEKTKHV